MKIRTVLHGGSLVFFKCYRLVQTHTSSGQVMIWIFVGENCATASHFPIVRSNSQQSVFFMLFGDFLASYSVQRFCATWTELPNKLTY